MHIIDLDGKKIEITDLSIAIMQADDYRHYTVTDPAGQEFGTRQQAYWNEIYQKLLQLNLSQEE